MHRSTKSPCIFSALCEHLTKPVGLRDIAACLALTFILAACHNGNFAEQPAVPDTQSAAPPKAAESQPNLWLGRRAILLATAPTRLDPVNVATDPPKRVWRVRAGESVASAVRRWAEVAGYTSLPNFTTKESWNFIVSQEFSGSFEDALVWLSNGFSHQPVKPVAVLFANQILDLVDRPTLDLARADARDGEPGKRDSAGE